MGAPNEQWSEGEDRRKKMRAGGEVDTGLDLDRSELMGSDEEEKGISVPVNV